MNLSVSAATKPTGVRFGVLGFACALSMITYLDRVCFGTVASNIKSELALSDEQLGIVFSAFALAYAALEVPSGWLGDRFGPKRTLIRIVLAWSLFTVLTGLIYPDLGGNYLFLDLSIPFVAMVVVRFLFGAGEAGAYPNIARAFHNWFPFQERGSAKGAVWMAGRFAGGVTSFLVFALLYETVVDGHRVTHWRHMFWIFGALGIFWCLAFAWWFKDRPELNPSVNKAELVLIHQGGDDSGRVRAVPWGRLLCSGNLWLLCLMYFCGAYGWYFNITYLPSYLRENFGLNEQTKWTAAWWEFSLMAGAPLLLGSVGCLTGGVLSDLFIKKTGNRKWGRRLFGVVGHSACAICYFAAIFANQNAWLFVLAIALAAFWNDVTMGAAWASCLDIGGKYSGIVAGCMNTIGNLGGAAAGFFTGYIITVSKKYYQAGILDNPIDAARMGWTINFLTFGGVYVVATLLWLGFDATKPVAEE